MKLNKLAKSILVITMILFMGQAAWAAGNASNSFAKFPEFKAKVRIIDLILAKVNGKPQVTHMIAEVVNVSEPANSDNSKSKEALEFIQKNAKQVTIMVTPEAEKQGKLLGFFNFFINGIHKTGLYKADSTIKAFQIDGINGWQLVLTKCHLLDQ